MSVRGDVSEPSAETTDGERTRSPSNPSMGYLLATWLRQSYDELGRIVLANAVLFLLGGIALTPSYLLSRSLEEGAPFFPLGGLLLGMGWVGIWWIACLWFVLNAHVEKVFTFQYPSWGESFSIFRRYWVTSLGTLTFLGGGFGILAFNFWTYPAMLAEYPLIRIAALILTVWLGLFLGLVQVHLVPFLVHQNRPFFTALKRAAMVAVWRPFRTLTILVVQILLAMLYFIPPFFLIVPGFYAVLSNLSLLILLEEWKDPYQKTREAIRAGV